MKELEVKVSNFKPRWYQRELINEIEHSDKRQFLIVWPRRAGKDVAALNIMIRQAFKRVGVYFYLYPKVDQCRRAIWDSILITGEPFLDFIPKDLIAKKNEVDMKIKLINGSIIQFNGADNVKALLSTNPVGLVYSEFATVSNPDAYSRMRPILATNDGWVLFVSTPAPDGYLFQDLYDAAKKLDDWYTRVLTVNDTKHISLEKLAKEKREMSEEKFLMEYYCSFESYATGSYYVKNVNMAYAENRIGFVPFDSMHKVNTSWDIGFRSPSVILFYQIIGKKICVIDMYHKSNEALDHYVNTLNRFTREKGYVYGSHFVPHDAVQHEVGSGLTRLGILSQLGLEATVLPRSLLHTGIEVVKHLFKGIFIDEANCLKLIKALKEYSKKWDPLTKRFLNKDTETWANDFCDAFRYMCLSVSLIGGNERSTEEFNNQRIKLMYGVDSKLPSFYRT